MDGEGSLIALTSGLSYEAEFELWLFDRAAGTTTLVGVPSSAVCPQQGDLSTDGRRMVFVSCPAVEDPFRWTPWIVDFAGLDQTITPLQEVPSVDSSIGRISSEGSHVVVSTSALHPGGLAEVVSVEVATDVLTRLSSPSDGAACRFDTDGDGRTTAFTSTATDLVPDDVNGAADVFVRFTPAAPR